MSFCSPLAKDQEKCFSPEDLQIFVNIYNKYFPNKIKTISYNGINNKLKDTVGNKKHYLWFDYLCQYCSYAECQTLNNITDNRLLPKKPAEWYKNKTAWLSNFDIEDVLVHYHKCKKYNYEFVGVFSVDFAVKDPNGKCKYYENKCTPNIPLNVKNNKKYLGIVTNLDRYDQGGSHWTSIFIVIDPQLPAYGIYYYDSGGNGIPPLIMLYLTEVKKQLYKLYPTRRCNIKENKKQYQRTSTECGMFALTYQIRWVTKLFKNKNTLEPDVLDNRVMTDQEMIQSRDKIFSPRFDKG
jgi:hypothetical protein